MKDGMGRKDGKGRKMLVLKYLKVLFFFTFLVFDRSWSYGTML